MPRPTVATSSPTSSGRPRRRRLRRAAEGLRLNVRQAVVEPELDVVPGTGGWRPLRVVWPAGVDHGAWRSEPGWVMAVVSRGPHPGEVRMDPAAPPHRSTAARRWSHAGAVVNFD